MDKKLIKFVENIINPVYIVGGCVRDHYLGKEPHDYDFCTPYTPDEMENRINASGNTVINVGKKFGTLGIKYGRDIIEVTSFRKESYKPGSRKPDVVFVGDIIDDLARRDFTINSMAMAGEELIDPFGGLNDMKAKIIRATGNPTERFKEDPLRMLRACRFAGQLGFDIEEQTFKKMKEHSQLIIGVSQERWAQELDKLLMGDFVEKGLRYLFDSELIKYIIPELGLQYNYDQNSVYHKLMLHEHTIQTVGGTIKDINHRWAAFLHDVGKNFTQTERKLGGYGYHKHELVGAIIVEHIGLYLHFSFERMRVVSELVKKHMEDDSPLKKADSAAHKAIK